MTSRCIFQTIFFNSPHIFSAGSGVIFLNQSSENQRLTSNSNTQPIENEQIESFWTTSRPEPEVRIWTLTQDFDDGETGQPDPDPACTVKFQRPDPGMMATPTTMIKIDFRSGGEKWGRTLTGSGKIQRSRSGRRSNSEGRKKTRSIIPGCALFGFSVLCLLDRYEFVHAVPYDVITPDVVLYFGVGHGVVGLPFGLGRPVKEADPAC